MKGEIYLKKPADFAHVHQQGRYLGGSLLSIKSAPNGRELSRWAVITSKRLGKAVVRNKIKRRLREILRQSKLSPGEDILIIARQGAVIAGYQELQKSATLLLEKAGLIKTNEISCPDDD